ncbi:MAG: hypothetical protein WA919_30385 [Coleofasciculaceae cyanobacterium]
MQINCFRGVHQYLRTPATVVRMSDGEMREMREMGEMGEMGKTGRRGR